MFLNQSEQSYHLWYSNIWKLFPEFKKKMSFWHNFDKRIACLFMNVPSIRNCFETFRHNSKIRSNEYEKKLFIRRSHFFSQWECQNDEKMKKLKRTSRICLYSYFIQHSKTQRKSCSKQCQMMKNTKNENLQKMQNKLFHDRVLHLWIQIDALGVSRRKIKCRFTAVQYFKNIIKRCSWKKTWFANIT